MQNNYGAIPTIVSFLNFTIALLYFSLLLLLFFYSISFLLHNSSLKKNNNIESIIKEGIIQCAKNEAKCL